MSLLLTNTLVPQLAGLIENMILDGTFKVGSRLKEADLEEKFGTSRTPLREALRLLESQGLIETIPRKGSFVKKIDIREISDISEIRITLETLAVKLAHQRMTSVGLKKLKKELEGMEEALQAQNAKDFMEKHEKYHSTLISLTGNSWLEKELYNLRKIMQWHRFYYQYHAANFEYSLKSHQEQFKLLSDPDSDDEILCRIDAETTRRGCELLLEHIKKTEQSLPEKDCSD